MAQTRKRSSTGTRKTGTAGSKKTNRSKQRPVQAEPMDYAIKSEIIVIIVFALAVFLFLCNFKIMGVVGNSVSDIMFGIFGLPAYIAPVFLFIAIAFRVSNSGNSIATRKIIAGTAIFLLIGIACEFLATDMSLTDTYQITVIFERGKTMHNGGGIIAGSLAYLLYHFLGIVGSVLLMLVLAVISVVVMTEKSFVSGVKQSSERLYHRSVEDAQERRERNKQRRQQLEEEKQRRQEEQENEKILRMNKKVSGVMMDTTLIREPEVREKIHNDIHEITLQDFDEQIEHPMMGDNTEQITYESHYEPEERYFEQLSESNDTEEIKEIEYPAQKTYQEPEHKEPAAVRREAAPKKYMFPPISKLNKGKGKQTGNQERELHQTKIRLQETLKSFGVDVTITDVSQGPSVTRYELQPKQGVKVSKIVGLADDIKLNLAATDIRIEAPIPGKSAVGIEVPNKENATVAFRDLIESKEFKEFPSNLAFAVGKDIGGKIIVADIAKMPHMLIAGATGSGKSVCINTLIMSILYKAHPDDVKLIMIDPKVVELSVYNSIPHLLIPVVTDPKKASGALHWGVAEMTDRYQKFADYNVRDLKGFNQKMESLAAKGQADLPEKLPQIVIIVDELADLMMVAPGEVEESICRLAQLARAAGIHLIIATQRPSVDVITGLIKANMPSRVAFSVSSGVDSRTIIDMNGAEKLLGKGDMLFYPQGYSKPARVQGAFISDKEVSDVVDFLKNQSLGNVYSEDVEEKISSMGTSAMTGMADKEGQAEHDQHFADAGRFIIEKDKASIGMLQRVFKIGFNRAARIMDQLCEAGVVGEEEGTKPRKVLMSMEEFELYLEEHV